MSVRSVGPLVAALVALAVACSSESDLEAEPDTEPDTTEPDAAVRTDAAPPPSRADAGAEEPEPPDAAPDASPSLDGCSAAVTAPPSSLALDAFYTKYLDAHGVPVVSSDAPDDAALRTVCRLAVRMMEKRDDVRLAAIERSLRIGVMGTEQVTTDMPEHADLNEVYPPTNWDERARGLGATPTRPLSSCAEENVLCLSGDRYAGDNIFVHEFAHSLYGLGVIFADPTFPDRLRAAYDTALAAGRWANTYAGSNTEEYWAEGVQSYLEAHIEAIPPNGIHNEIDTRAELEAYDPGLTALIAEVFDPIDLPHCP